MRTISVRFPEPVINYVRKVAKSSGEDESHVWRLLVQKGIDSLDGKEDILQTVLKISIQSLCLSQRLTGHHNEELVIAARDDAKKLLQKLGST